MTKDVRLVRLDLAEAELQNCVRVKGVIKSRPAFLPVIFDIGSPCIGAKSVRSASGQYYLYVFYRTSSGGLQCRIYDENMVLLTNPTLTLDCSVSDGSVLSFAVDSYNHLVINSKGFSNPLICTIGSKPVRALKVEGPNPDTPSLTVPVGPVSSFGDRIVWSYGNSAYISYPGAEPRILTATNLIATKGEILDMVEGPDSNLYIFSQGGSVMCESAGLTSVTFDGRTTNIKSYTSLHSGNIVSNRFGIFGLYSNGVIELSTDKTRDIGVCKYPRILSSVLGMVNNLDIRRHGRLHSWSRGLVVSFGAGDPFCVIDLENDYISWWDDTQVDSELVGVVESDDGIPIFVFASDGGFALFGNNLSADCVVGINAVTTGLDQPVTREIIVSVSADGLQKNKFAIDGDVGPNNVEIRAMSAPGSSLIGTGVWDTAITKAYKPESIRSQFALRQDSPYIEVKLGRNQELFECWLRTTPGQGQTRHRQEIIQPQNPE